MLRHHVVIWRPVRYYSVRNAYEVLHQYAVDQHAVVVNLDADDWFARPTALAEIAEMYHRQHCLLSYGNCLVWQGRDLPRLPLATEVMPACNTPYPPEIIRDRSYRRYPFLVYHPRTWSVAAFQRLPRTAFQRADGSWLQYCEDQAIFFPLLEMFGHRCICSSQPWSVYNQANPLADVQTARLALLRDEIEIRRQAPYAAQDL